METCILQYTGSRVTLIDKILNDLWKLDTKDCKRELAGANNSKSFTERVTVRVSTKILEAESINWLVHPSLPVGSMNYDYCAFKRGYLQILIL